LFIISLFPCIDEIYQDNIPLYITYPKVDGSFGGFLPGQLDDMFLIELAVTPEGARKAKPYFAATLIDQNR
jgi:hypothetical protein